MERKVEENFQQHRASNKEAHARLEIGGFSTQSSHQRKQDDALFSEIE